MQENIINLIDENGVESQFEIILTLEAIGIALNFIEVLFNVKLNTLFIILNRIDRITPAMEV